MSIWIDSSSETAVYTWPLMPGLEVFASCLGGKLVVGYMLGAAGDEVVLRARPFEMQRSREVYGLGFTYGEA
jgi:hypothetical protein